MDWKRLIIGDAFALPSRDVNYYRDIFLAWPFLISAIVAVSGAIGSHHDYRVTAKSASLALLCLLFAREKRILIAVALGFVCMQSAISFVLKHDWLGLAISILSGVVLLLLLIAWRDYKPSYRVSKDGTTASLLVNLVSFALTLAIFHYWIRP